MKHLLTMALMFGLATAWSPAASAFCGFFVAKADSQLFNEASQVVIVRDGDRTVMTLSNDFKGDVKEFGMVIPVPTFIEKGQIHVAERALLDHLDAYSAPRLVEYFDENPCDMRSFDEDMLERSVAMDDSGGDNEGMVQRAKTLGVTIEAQYTVGEYDIVILSAKESDGLVAFLEGEGYKIPKGATKILGSYMKQNMRFFLAKVNLEEQSKLGFSYLRPLQVAYESPKFMLPIRLGTVNARGDQELFVYILTRNGRVEATNYRTIKLPTGQAIPVYVKDKFGDFYKDMFATLVDKHNKKAVFTEYSWNMAWCDPCAADPLTAKELKDLGVFWLADGAGRSQAQNVYMTRLHVRYNAETFPEDLTFQETKDTGNFQGRYVLRHPWKGGDTCPAADQYYEQLARRQDQEAKNLADLTGWKLSSIRKKMKLNSPANRGGNWWEKLWE